MKTLFKARFKGPAVVLILLTSLNLLNYIDRFIFSALLPAIKDDLHFSDQELGILGSGFIIAYLMVSPLFGLLGDRFKRTKVMSMGVAIWSVATTFSGLTRSFAGQLTGRFIVGLGESSYTVVSPGFLSDIFPKSSRGRVFAIYSGAISIGSALGYVIGGLLEPRFGWQRSFFIVGVPGIILSGLILLIENPKRGGNEDQVQTQYKDIDQKKYFLKSTKELFSNGGYVTAVLGYSAYTFVVGGLAFWMPSYIVRYFHVGLQEANLTFGGLTVVGGFFGTIVGGFISDLWEKKRGNAYLKLAVTSLLLAVPLFWLSLQIHNFHHYCIVVFFLEFALFTCLSPIDTAVLSMVRPEVRSMAMAWDVFVIHFLGDGISRTLMGSVSDHSGLNAAMAICPWVLLLAACIWMVSVIFFWQPASWGKNHFRLPLLQSHRGFTEKGRWQENTLPAFESSRSQKFEALELDVRLSQDGEVVVFHDSNLRRFAQLKQKVPKISASALKDLVGAPSLREVLKSNMITPLINIEIKSNDFKYHRLVKEVLKVVEEQNAGGRVLISSFNPFVIRLVAKLSPQILRAYLVNHMGLKMLPGHILFSFLAHPHMLNIQEKYLNKYRMEHFRKRGIPIVAWTVNSRERAQELVRLGVQSVITDDILPHEMDRA